MWYNEKIVSRDWKYRYVNGGFGMKKVALISDGWKRNIIYAWADGIMIKINEYAEEVTLHHYNCYGNWCEYS